MAKKNNTADIGFEEILWAAADKMRNNMDPAEYKHVILGLIFLKYISDKFEEKFNELKETGDQDDLDYYIAENIFYVVPEARWDNIRDNAKLPEIGSIVDNAMIQIEKENESLKGVLPKSYSRPDLDKEKLGEIIDLISTINMSDKNNEEKDMLGRVYEYFLGKFASSEGKGGGEFYTPATIVKLLVEMIEPYKGRIYDPCCGSGGMFVQSEQFIKTHQGKLNDLAVYGQESNPTTWRLCKMNLAIRGIEGNIGEHYGDTFHNDLHQYLKADYILANPPFNISDWGGNKIQDDKRWRYGVPPNGNANYAWIQHFIHHLSPNGTAGFILANGALSSNTSNEGKIRQSIIENDLVDCIVALPSQLFYSTGIPVSLWFLSKNKIKSRDRKNSILFIDARKMGEMVTRKYRELSSDDINKISATYHNWKTEALFENYEDTPGFCKSAKLEEIKEHDYILTPGRYVGIEEEEDDGIPFEDKMKVFTSELSEQFKKSKELEERIRKNLSELGFEI